MKQNYHMHIWKSNDLTSNEKCFPCQNFGKLLKNQQNAIFTHKVWFYSVLTAKNEKFDKNYP